MADAHPPAVLALRPALRRPLPNASCARVGGERFSGTGTGNRRPDQETGPGPGSLRDLCSCSLMMPACSPAS